MISFIPMMTSSLEVGKTIDLTWILIFSPVTGVVYLILRLAPCVNLRLTPVPARSTYTGLISYVSSICSLINLSDTQVGSSFPVSTSAMAGLSFTSTLMRNALPNAFSVTNAAICGPCCLYLPSPTLLIALIALTQSISSCEYGQALPLLQSPWR